MRFERPRRTVDYIVAVLLLVVPAIFLHSNFKDPTKTNTVDRVVLRVSSPLQRGVTWVIEGVSHLWGRYVWLVDVDEENAELRRENEELRRRLTEASARIQELEEYRSLARVREGVPAESVGARVVAVGTNPYFRVTRIVIDRGESDQVKEGMPVISDRGVVGRIARVYGSYADVLLAVDSRLSIDVVVEGTGARGVLKGRSGDNVYGCKIDYLLRSDEVKKDDRVVTSGLGGVFPRNLEVGKVREVRRNEYGLYQEVDIEPSVDFSRLKSVIVVLAPPPPPDPGAESRKSPEAAFGVSPYK